MLPALAQSVETAALRLVTAPAVVVPTVFEASYFARQAAVASWPAAQSVLPSLGLALLARRCSDWRMQEVFPFHLEPSKYRPIS